MFSSATQPPRHPPLHDNFVVSEITFEGIKLRSSSSIIDIVVPSKMAAGNGQKCDRKLFADIQN